MAMAPPAMVIDSVRLVRGNQCNAALRLSLDYTHRMADDGELFPVEMFRQTFDDGQAVEEIVRNIRRIVVGQTVAGDVDSDNAQILGQ